MPKQIPSPSPSDSFPIRNHVDGNNTKQISSNPRPLEIERGHDFWTDSETGKRTEKPDWAKD